MNRLEEALKQALRREAAPEGFAERVIARAAASDRGARPWSWPYLLRWTAAAAVPAAILLVVQVNTEQRRRAEGEMARARVMAAMRITANSLESAREKVVRATGQQDADKPI
jgi:hypothetical protein